MRKVRENILAASGNQSIFPADTPVFICPSDNEGPTLNGVLDGQMVIYDHASGVSVGPGVTTANTDRLVIGIGCDLNGDGAADVLRKPFGDKVYGCNIQAATAEPPRCGIPMVTDMFFKCVHCEEQFGVQITVEDDLTQNQFPFNRPAEYTFTVDTGCCECDTCEDGIDCDLLACKLIDQINNKTGVTDPRKQSVFPKLARRKPKLPFHAVKLYGGFARASINYCLNPVSDVCGNCIDIDAITGFSWTNPESGLPEVVTFTNTTNPASPTLSLQAQIPRITAQMNTALNGFGSAVVSSSLGVDSSSGLPAAYKGPSGRPCCPYLLQINTCVTDFVLLGDGGAPIADCGASDPFAPIALPNECKDCANPAAATLTPTCGIRIIAKPVEINCNCDLGPDTPRGYLGRDIKVQPLSGFACGSTYVQNVQAQVLPENIGYIWQTREGASDNGGSGRDHNPWGYDPHGKWGAPLRNSRGYSHKSVCSTLYCSYILEHSIPNTDIGVHGNKTGARGRTVILIPSTDTVTRTEFEAIINPYLLSTDCPVKQSIECQVDPGTGEFIDQDQIEQIVDPGTGLVIQDEYPNTGGGYIQ